MCVLSGDNRVHVLGLPAVTFTAQHVAYVSVSSAKCNAVTNPDSFLCPVSVPEVLSNEQDRADGGAAGGSV